MSVIAIPVNRELGVENRSKSKYDKGLVIEEIKDVIKVHKNGGVERSSSTIESVTPFLPPNLDVTARDVYIDRPTNVWARTYVPKRDGDSKLPLLVYFHGGGFCVGSTSWKCYHEFLGNLSSKARCVIVSVNYRLAPENRLPAAYEDGIKALMWVKQQEKGPSTEYWTKYCDFSSIFLGGDSAGANIAYNVGLKLEINNIIKGIIMAQPFFGGEKRSNSEKSSVSKSSKSTLSMGASDAYWRLALPVGANRDHGWCNPVKEGVGMLENTRVMVCVAEEDVLRDRNMEFCLALGNNGNNQLKMINYQGVAHGFQVVDKSQVSEMRKNQMMDHILDFINAQ